MKRNHERGFSCQGLSSRAQVKGIMGAQKRNGTLKWILMIGWCCNKMSNLNSTHVVYYASTCVLPENEEELIFNYQVSTNTYLNLPAWVSLIPWSNWDQSYSFCFTMWCGKEKSYCVIFLTFGCRFQPPTPCLLPRPLWLENDVTDWSRFGPWCCWRSWAPAHEITRAQSLMKSHHRIFCPVNVLVSQRRRKNLGCKIGLPNLCCPQGIWFRNEAMSDESFGRNCQETEKEKVQSVWRSWIPRFVQWFRRPWRLLRRAFSFTVLSSLHFKQGLSFPFHFKALGNLTVLFSSLLLWKGMVACDLLEPAFALALIGCWEGGILLDVISLIFCFCTESRHRYQQKFQWNTRVFILFAFSHKILKSDSYTWIKTLTCLI